MRFLFVALGSWCVVSGAAASIAACAATDDADPKEERGTATVPEAGTEPEWDAAADADGGVRTPDCAEVDFCPTTFPVSRLVSLNAIWGSGPNDVWAVGTRGMILHGDGTEFTPISIDVGSSTEIYVAVWGTSSSDVWILGPSFPLQSDGHHGASTVFEPREGSSWTPGKAATGRLWAGASAGSQVWLAGESSARFGASSSFWTLGTDPSGAPIWNPSETCTDARPCSPSVRALWAADETIAWAVGHDGQAFVWDAVTASDAAPPRWLAQNTNTRDDLEAVWGSGPNDVWAVGRRGIIRHTSRGSSSWTVVASPTKTDLHAVWGSGPTDVWAAGDAGTILHYDGSAWTVATLSLPNGDTPTNLYGIWGSGPDDVWIVGEGLILHHTAANRRHP